MSVATAGPEYGSWAAAPFKPPGSRKPAWGWRDVLILLALLALSAALRFPRLSQPRDLVFDETYYGKDACIYVGLGQHRCGTDQPTEQTYVHPPLGKWIIAAGVKTFGYTPFGRRVAAAIFGTGLVAVAYLFARALFASRVVAGLAGLLAATDALLLVESRLAMLDIFLAFFVALGFFFLALDRADALGAGRRHLRWRVLAGVCLGAAASVKWSGGLALAGGLVMAMGWSLRALRRDRSETGTSAPGELASLAVSFLVAPAAVYLASYVVWFRHNHYDLVAFFRLQKSMLDYHLTLKAKHPYQSRAWTWPFVIRPVAYYWKDWKGRPKASEIMAFGNPAVWWPAVLAGVWLLVRSFRAQRPERLVLAGWVSQYLPWLIVARPLFFFYMTPVVVFMMTALAAGLVALGRRGRALRIGVIAYVVLAVGVATWFFYPLVAGLDLSVHGWNLRIWLGNAIGNWV